MSNFSKYAVLAGAMAGSVSAVAFQAGESISDVQTEITQRLQNNETLDAIVRDAAVIPTATLTAALIADNFSPASVFTAMIAANRPSADVYAAAVASGATAAQLAPAVVAAGLDPATLLRSPAAGPTQGNTAPSSTSFSSSPAATSASGGGGSSASSG
jgi:hypothetical protein